MKQLQSTLEFLQTELDWGYVIGPYDSISNKSLKIAVGKYSGKERLIHVY